MKTQTTKLNRILAVACCAAAVMCQPLLLAADHDKTEHAQHQDPMAANIAKLSGAEFEAAFLSLMIQHHQSGVKMAKLAVEKATNDKLKAMMRKAAGDQQQEIEQMTGWLQQWHKKSPQDHKMPEESMKMMEKDMAELQAAAGEEFDKLFAEKMAHHHSGAIAMAKQAVDKAEHKEVKELAQNVIKVQTKEQHELHAIHEGKSEKHTKKE